MDNVFAIERCFRDFRLAEAESLLESLQSTEVREEVQTILRGYLHLARGRTLLAEISFAKCESSTAKYYRAISLYLRGHYAQSIAMLDKIAAPELEIETILPGSIIFRPLGLRDINQLKRAALLKLENGLHGPAIRTENGELAGTFTKKPRLQREIERSRPKEPAVVAITPRNESTTLSFESSKVETAAIHYFRSRKYLEAFHIVLAVTLLGSKRILQGHCCAILHGS